MIQCSKYETLLNSSSLSPGYVMNLDHYLSSPTRLPDGPGICTFTAQYLLRMNDEVPLKLTLICRVAFGTNSTFFDKCERR